MRKRFWLVGLLVAFALFFILQATKLKSLFAVDTCLDMGGCWDYTSGACLKEEPDAQARCHRSLAVE